MNSVNVAQVVNQGRLSPFQFLVLSFCTLAMVIDGFDVQAMAYVAPAVLKEFGIAKADLGPVFGAGLVGMVIGTLSLSIVADKLGRRPVLIAATALTALCMFITASAESVQQLIVMRFVTGFGMGAIIPNVVALSNEYSPARIKVTVVMLVSCGFLVGGALGGAFASQLIPAFGWRSVFIAGAAAPLLLAVAMLAWMPESMQFLVIHGKRLDRVRHWLTRIDPQLRIDASTGFQVEEKSTKGMPVVSLFRDGLAVGTVLLWVINFVNLLSIYFLASWLPVLMAEAGHQTSQAVLAATLLWVGGIIGTLVMGWVIDHHGFGPVLVAIYIVAALAIATIGQVAGTATTAFATILIAGFCVVGGQTVLNALSSLYYPTHERSTGVGWAAGMGRMGSIVGPVVGAALLSLKWSTEHLFIAAAVPAVIGLVASFIFWRLGLLPLPAAARHASSATVAKRA
jgi:AAHS family 4-hydroxybenzoate transporter-like MFS transporter